MIYTAEYVSKYHPDKVCDQISDAILDECLKQDPNSRVAVETMGGHGEINLTGEVTTKAKLDYDWIAKNVYRDLFKDSILVLSNIVSQSSDISQGVDKGGAGDQGIMVGYAYRDTKTHLPPELELARDLLAPFETDAKSQVTIEDDRVTEVVLSVQGKTQTELVDYLDIFKQLDYAYRYCNYTGSFDIGGFDADAGVTGRKIVIDQYGPRVPVGGGAFSGKDPTKVDRSAAYMARFIALDQLRVFTECKEVTVKLAYCIGKAEPVMAIAQDEAGNEWKISMKDYDCRPQAIIERFDLKKPIYLDLARNGHFGRPELPWEIEI